MDTSQQVTDYIQSLNDWRGELVGKLRELICEAAPELAEEWKWGTPVWSYKGNVVAVGAFKDHVKVNFFKGAQLDDPHGMINAGIEAKTSRGIDIRVGEHIDESGLKELVQAAVALNTRS